MASQTITVAPVADDVVLNVAIYGFGRIGRVHARNTIASPLLKLKYIIDIPAMRSIIEKEHAADGVQFLENTEEDVYLKDDSIAFAIVCNPTEFHVDTCVKSFDAGKHVLCEKPISLDVKEIRRCYDSSEKNSKVLLCGFNRRFDSRIRTAVDQVRQHQQRGAKVHRGLVISRDAPYPEGRFLGISGGIFHDCAVHDIDVLNWVFGEFPTTISVTGNYVMDADKSGADKDKLCVDNAVITATTASGKISTIISSRISKSYDQRIEIYGNDFDVNVTNPVDPFDPNLAAEDAMSFQKRYADSYVVELAHMDQVCRGREQPLTNRMDSIAACTIADACGVAFTTGLTQSITVTR